MGLFDSVGLCFERYATFAGRASRPEYWWWTLFALLAGVAARLVDVALRSGGAPGVAYAILSLLLFLPGLAVFVRRLHDTDHSGWWMWIGATIVGPIPLTIWLCREGTSGGNAYGPDPRSALARSDTATI